MLDFEQQANQAQALASLDDDWHLLEGERTTFAIFFLPFLYLPRKVHKDRRDGCHAAQNLNRRDEIARTGERERWSSLPKSNKFQEITRINLH